MPPKLKDLWNKTLILLQNELSKPSFDTWIKSVQPLSLDHNQLSLQAPNEFAKDWLESRYADSIKRVFCSIINSEVELIFLLPDEVNQSSFPGNATATSPETLLSMLNPKYTFDTFVVGNNNRFAHAATLAVAEAPSRTYNPLFIYGGVGLGKTHLLHAIGHYVHTHKKRYQVLYVSSEKFTNELINSIRDDLTEEFRFKYRNIDVLLIDDIQFLAGKERTQEEFFHTFNSLYEATKQIIISSDRPPKDIPTLEERLRSRFEWGLITDIQPPDLETRIAIIRKKVMIENYPFSNEIISYIANRIHTNIRELEGSLIRISAYASLKKQPISIDLVNDALRDILPSNRQRPITIRLIQETVADRFGLKVDDLKGKKRSRQYSLPRQIAMYLSRTLTDLSLPRIGSEFGGRDHTTVIHACTKIHDSLLNDAEIYKTITSLTETIK